MTEMSKTSKKPNVLFSDMKQQYRQSIVPKMVSEFGYQNVHQVPKLVSIVVSMGTAKKKDRGAVAQVTEDLASICAQKPIVTKARKSISNFKLRKGYPVGLKTTLRNRIMFDFFFRLIHIVVPRIRDFQGFSKKADGRGCYSFGLPNQHSFPEIDLDRSKEPQGMNITFVTTANSDQECISLLSHFGFPFQR